MFASARADMDESQIIKLFEARPISNLFIVSDLTTVRRVYHVFQTTEQKSVK